MAGRIWCDTSLTGRQIAMAREATLVLLKSGESFTAQPLSRSSPEMNWSEHSEGGDRIDRASLAPRGTA